MSNLTCENCNKLFSTKSNLNAHIRSVKCGKKKEVAKYKCEFCDRVYLHEHSYQRHNKTCNNGIISEYKRKNGELEKLVQTQALEISRLEKELAFEKGHIHGLEKAKPTKTINNNCTTINSKVDNIPITTIKPFTVNSIVEELLPQYVKNSHENF